MLSSREVAELNAVISAAFSTLETRIRAEVPPDIEIRQGSERFPSFVRPGDAHYLDVLEDFVRKAASRQSAVLMQFLFHFEDGMSKNPDAFTERFGDKIGADRIARVRDDLPRIDQSTLAVIIRDRSQKNSNTVMIERIECLEQIGLVRRTAPGNHRYVSLTGRGSQIVGLAGQDSFELLVSYLQTIGASELRTPRGSKGVEL